MNQSYRVVWNEAVGAWQAVCEICRSNGKSKSSRRALHRASLMAAGSLFAAAQAFAAGLPTGGNVVAGSGSISQSGTSMTINQSTAKMAVDWQSFSVGQGNTVNFVQPSTSAVALNRVLGSDVSVIQGAINANGQVFLLNPNGVLFTPTAQVNVGSLVASTLKMSTSDFMAGNYKLSGDSSNAVINQGNITAVGDGTKGGAIALIAAKVINEGNLTANGGNVQLGAASEVVLDLGGPVKLQVTQGAIDALVQNSGAIQADGGLIYLTAQAVNTLTTATINNTGVIRAQTLATGEKGEIRLMGDMKTGTVNVGGTLDASAPNGGDGGMIETSAAQVNTLSNLSINAGSVSGRGGEWLIDPYDYTIGASQATTIANALNTGTGVTVSTQAANGISGYTAPSGSGDITVSSAISKTSGGTATLTLRADRNIAVNANIGSTSGKLNITLSAANNASSNLGGVSIAAGKTLNSNGGDILIGGAGGNVAGAQTASHGIGYALNSSASREAVSVGASAQVLSRGGDITINGYSTQEKSGSNDTTGVHIGGGAVIDSGYYAAGAASASSGGYINISGKYANSTSGADNRVFGVKIDNPSGSAGQTTISASTTTGAIRIEGSNAQDVNYPLNMATNGLAGNIYFNAYSVADLIFILNGSIQGVTFTYSPPNSGCRSGYPNCGLLSVNSSANNSYLYATYNAVNMSTLPIYVTATLTGTKVYDGSTTATGLSFSGLNILDPNGSGYQSSNVTSATYVTPSVNVGAYTNLTASSLSRNYSAGGRNYVVGYNFTVDPAYTITPAPLGITVSANYNGSTTFSSRAATITTTGLASTDTISSVTLSSADVANNATNYVTGLTGTSTNSTGFLASNYTIHGLNRTLSDSSLFSGSLTLSQAPTATTNAVWLNTAVLVGLAVSGKYNGTNTYSTIDGSTITVAGLQNGDVIDSVSVNDANVSANGSNFVTAILTGHRSGGTFLASNYSFNGGANYTLSDNSTFNGTLASGVLPVVGATPGASTNAVVISRAPLNVSVTGVYNGGTTITPTSGSTYSGWVGADATTPPTVTSATISNANVATNNKYVISVSDASGVLASLLDGSTVTLTSAGGGNYYLNNGHNASASNNGANPQNVATLSPATLTVIADDKTKVYGNTDPALSYTVTGLLGSDTLTGALARTAGESVNGGPYAINLGTLANSNYSISYTNGLFTITPRPITVAADDKSKPAGSADPLLTYSLVSGSLVGNDTLGNLVRGPGEVPGTYVIDAHVLQNSNYQITAVDGNLVISAALQPPPAAPIIVPAFPDNGIKAIINETRPPEFGGMNYVAARLEGAAPTAAGQSQGAAPTASTAPTQGGAMNYVSISSKVTDAGQELQVRLPEDKNRKPQSELNVNNTTVSSNTSPLDVFVVDTGINLSNLNNGK